MFNCDYCRAVSNSGDQERQVVVEWRVKDYPAALLPAKFGETFRRSGRPGTGYETVAIKRACPRCVEAGLAVPASVPAAVLQRELPIPVENIEKVKSHFKNRTQRWTGAPKKPVVEKELTPPVESTAVGALTCGSLA